MEPQNGNSTVPERGAGTTVLTDPKAERLLAMATGYQRHGKVWQAMELYWTLLDRFPETGQAESAREALMTLALTFEREGQQHLARSLYERLL